MERFEKNRLEKKFLKYIFGDDSDEKSGLSLVELRNLKNDAKDKNDVFVSEYESRKAKLAQVIWDYFSFFSGEDDDISEDSIKELLNLIDFFMLTFVPDPSKDREYVLHYLRKALKRTKEKNTVKDGFDKNNYSKIKKWEKRFNSVRPELKFDIQNNLHQEFLAEIFLADYLSKKECKDEVKRKKIYLKRIKEAARLARVSVESMDYQDSKSTSSKIDTLEVVENNRHKSSKEEEKFRALFAKINERFSHSQDREGKSTRKYLSALITIRLVREKNKSNSLDVLFLDLMAEYDFSDKELLRELRQDFDKGTKFPKQKEIAARFVRPATGNERKGDDASRYLKPYVKIMKENLS